MHACGNSKNRLLSVPPSCPLPTENMLDHGLTKCQIFDYINTEFSTHSTVDLQSSCRVVGNFSCDVSHSNCIK